MFNNCFSGLPAWILLLATIANITALPLQYKIDYAAVDRVELSFTVPEKSSTIKQDSANFAFSTVPGGSFTVLITGRGSQIPFRLLGAGWAGKNYLQWLSFPLKSLHCYGGKISIEFDPLKSPIVRPENITVKNGLCLIPFSRGLSKAALSKTESQPFTSGIRMEIDQDGIYEITPTELKSMGISLDRINSRTFRLFEKGKEIPIYITNSHHATLQNGDRILFYGKYLRSPTGSLTQFSNTNVYWLTWGSLPGTRITEVSCEQRKSTTDVTDQALRARDFIDTIHFETDAGIYWMGNVNDVPSEDIQNAPEADTLDNWYWGTIGISELTHVNLTIPSPSTSNGYARMRIGFVGLTRVDSINPDHFVKVFLNENTPGNLDSAVWDGQHEFVFAGDSFPVKNIINGVNDISFLCPNRGYVDRSALNWIEMTYLRGYQAFNNELLFRNIPNAIGNIVEYTLRGFTSDQLELWDIDQNRYLIGFSVIPETGKDKGKYSLIFQDSIYSPVNYYAVASDYHHVPLNMKLDTVKAGCDSAADADYIVISVDSFRTDLQPLLDAHKAKGLRTAFIDIDDIYNRFSAGIRDPESIRAFLKHLFAIAKKSSPRYLLLGGDTTHDLDKNNRKRNIIPTHLSRIPGWGPGADDGYFATFQGNDKFPDIHVGRLPAQNRLEMKTLVDKSVKYINSPDHGFWRDNLLLLGGGEKEFTEFNDEAVAEPIGPRMNVLRMDAYSGSPYYKDETAAPKYIADQINAGVFMINFNGHGGGNIWSDNNFFGYRDLGRLYNGQWSNGSRLPMIFSFTCLTGFFESAMYRSLGEEFIRTNQHGAVCFYGASAYTSRDGNMIMNKMFLDEALSGSFSSVGELIDFCEMNVLVRYGVQYIHLVRQYNLLGDPALPWAITPDTIHFSPIKSSLKTGDSLKVSGTCGPVTKGQVKYSVKSGDKTWSQTIDNVDKGIFSHGFTVKDSASTASGLVRVYAWNDSDDVRGWIDFTKDTLMINGISIEPSRPFFGDSITVKCELPIPDTSIHPSLYCIYTIAPGPSADNQFTGLRMEPDDAGNWTTVNKIPTSFTGDVNSKLLLYFRISSDQGSKQSDIFTYPIQGRPDLVFTGDSVEINWSDDSLRINFQTLNMGNATAPPFETVFLWGDKFNPGDTITRFWTNDSLQPGKMRSFSFAVPDTQGQLRFTGIINPGNDFTEILTDNNSIAGHLSLRFKNIKLTTDTLNSSGNGLRISPAESFKSSYRVFIIDGKPKTSQPLRSSSNWIPLNNDSISTMQIQSRPRLSATDSLLFIFHPESILVQPSKNKQESLRPAVVIYDSTLLRWRYAGGSWTGDNSQVFFVSNTNGTYSLANINDNRPPDILVSVHGRVLNTLDYAAKDKPFSINLTDVSEILPSSVVLYLNGKKLPDESRSVIPASGDLSSVTITAYPKPQQSIDSLLVTADDLAGNHAERTFAYMPGANLSIQFLACHPNPFSAKINRDGRIQRVRFAFLLTDIASELQMSIYTVSGKKIKSWKLNDMLGYQEIDWDGRDEDGKRIANGTYYAKLTASNDHKKVKKIIRIAKLEGY